MKMSMEIPMETYNDLIAALKNMGGDGYVWIKKLEKAAIPCETYFDEDFGE